MKDYSCHAQINVIIKSFSVKNATGPDSKAAKFEVKNNEIKMGPPKLWWCSTGKLVLDLGILDKLCVYYKKTLTKLLLR